MSSSPINEVADRTVTPNSPLTSSRDELLTVFRLYRGRLLLTYALFNIENVLRLAQPLLLGWAINDLLWQAYTGLFVFAIGHVAHFIMRSLRQMYDTRTFTRIYPDRAQSLVVRQRGRSVELSRVAARTMLSREFIVFLNITC